LKLIKILGNVSMSGAWGARDSSIEYWWSTVSICSIVSILGLYNVLYGLYLISLTNSPFDFLVTGK